MRWTLFDSPIGELSVAVDEVGVCGVRFDPVAGAARADAESMPPDQAVPGAGWRSAVLAQLRAYFTGELTDFTVPLSVTRGSDFERAVWREMTTIPYGEMRTYGEVATALGDPGAARAVGVACNRNPIPVIVPCHRIVGAGGKLVGFGGGLPRKRHLLELEARVALQRAWG
ncbi:methylated-DNA-[protein]-cysteine S-methyltransferase [Micromonospora pisi]|uniref:Methylated-DNA--protein-cysteine methyltransferase n=1 Tax=Micromonospora pisi TaxID=589240 RepID=A0A495JJV3_9ACTN|nr:methylated-DNA--[protein]-cysteine S-methyltransferase [Micromonospora pisi]RKR89296.1 methylated-DNA-[protein]-cysteine S-methyltransferase [Micromonospora pisi]